MSEYSNKYTEKKQQTDLFNRLVRLQSDVRNIGVHHEREQIQDQVGVSEEMVKIRKLYVYFQVELRTLLLKK